jgi:TRAP-type uncharacterized transport system substrate-binding protein
LSAYIFLRLAGTICRGNLVYQLVKAVFENQPRLLKTTSAASDTLPQNTVKDSFLPFHSGAVRYYREVGIKIPDALAATH